MKVLRVKIYQPHAHYRLPFTYQRRHTYPLPPYSTIPGLLINLCGNINHNIQGIEDFKVSISGRFGAKTTEMIWFRNLSGKAHTARFGAENNREINGHIEHPGGQSQMWIDVLEEVRLNLHFYHPDFRFLEQLEETFENPKDRPEVMHLGRAEDWLAFEDISMVELDKENGKTGIPVPLS